MNIMETFVDWGYLGLFVGSFLASTVIPMSADVLLVGVLTLGADVWVCLAVATAGNWLGGLTSYWIGWLGRWDWLERWFRVRREQLERQRERVGRFGPWLALFTWLPLVGDLFAIALGFYRISPRLSAFYMLVGRFARFLVWVLLYVAYADRFVEWLTK